MDTLERLMKVLQDVEALPDIMRAYEETGDHDHGNGRIGPGMPCPGGDCLVAKARKLLGESES